MYTLWMQLAANVRVQYDAYFSDFCGLLYIFPHMLYLHFSTSGRRSTAMLSLARPANYDVPLDHSLLVLSV